MRKLVKRIAGVMMALMMLFMPVMVTATGAEVVWAEGEEDKKDGAPETSILPNDWDVGKILELVLNVLVYGLGAAATLGVIISGVLYLTARDNEQQVVAAKKRLYEVVIGLVAWALMYAVLNWLIPGGLGF